MSESENQQLDGAQVAILVAEGTESVEFDEPKEALADAGADVDVIGPETGEVQTVENDLNEAETVEVERAIDDVSTDEYDGVVVPGGTVGADTLRFDDDVVSFVAAQVESGTPVGSICHGPWVLVEADVVDGRTLTSYPSLQTDVRNAGGEWTDEEVVTDESLITSRKPDDLDAFCKAVVDAVESTAA
ncbi:type 1 glutamine amidotransferase domain-containing protein [Haloarcula nitratireducens]|uniref:Type 1 glutamine amidotransferase n=1 Tax=Haloarcula nitratireducens TaxID=2487749 RepID=A0AAW4PBH8_9EURY|nr:type 1 glutamine amidotransferase domain-containing protein [Halomicroarcula nitratireducens]MBX0295337.1 type 1 glutamine amidotransferase [Halomicroarcula nitratireducens]